MQEVQRRLGLAVVFAIAVSFIASLTSCTILGDPCSTDLERRSLTVLVRDSRTGAAIASGASVTVVGSSGTEVFTFPSQPSADSGAFLSAATIPGEFTVTVGKMGYTTWSQKVVVKGDKCGYPVQAVVRAMLTPL